jgi:hypothetical protein
VHPSPLCNRRGVILPSGTACNFVGLGYIGCDFTFPCSSWVQGDIFMGASRGAPTSVQSLFHEMGHNQVRLGEQSRPAAWPGWLGWPGWGLVWRPLRFDPVVERCM